MEIIRCKGTVSSAVTSWGLVPDACPRFVASHDVNQWAGAYPFPLMKLVTTPAIPIHAAHWMLILSAALHAHMHCMSRSGYISSLSIYTVDWTNCGVSDDIH